VQELATNWASIHSSNGYISLSTYSGYRRCQFDPQGKHIVLKEECPNEELGNALLSVLEQSRVLTHDQFNDFFALTTVKDNYDIFVSNLLQKMGNMSRRKAFTKMKSCSVSVRSKVITLKPTRKERGEAWSGKGFTDLDNIDLPYSSKPVEIGKALKEVLAICK
jgi:CDI immunity protein